MNVKYIGILLSVFFITIINANPVNTNITIPIELPQDAFNNIRSNESQNLLPNGQHLAYFKQQYFRPWDDNTKQAEFSYVPGKSEVYSARGMETGTLDYYKGKTGYTTKYLPHDQAWLDSITTNMDLDNGFPNISCSTVQGGNGCKGIMVDNAELRSLPTTEAYYFDFEQPGEGYPFDYIQLSDMWLGTPVQLIHKTQDDKWVLVKGQGILGWVPAATVATVDVKFINKWRSQARNRQNYFDKFIIPTVRRQNIVIDNKKNVKKSVTLQIGGIFPKRGNKVLFPIRDNQGNAEIIKINAQDLAVQKWPLATNAHNFKQQINALSSMPYGWGGKDFHSDCSGLMRRLFIAFAIWLPRASTWQANYAGKKYILPQDADERKKVFKSENTEIEPKPFITLISFGNSANSASHITLYMGNTNIDNEEIPLMFHTPWGLKITRNSDTDNIVGRAVVGQSLISSIGIGESVSAGLLKQGWTLESLWNKNAMNITRLDQISECADGVHCSVNQTANANVDDKVIKEYLGIDSEDN